MGDLELYPRFNILDFVVVPKAGFNRQREEQDVFPLLSLTEKVLRAIVAMIKKRK